MTEVLQAPYATGWASLPVPRLPSETAALREKIARLEAHARDLEAEKRALRAELDQALHCSLTKLWTRSGWIPQAHRMAVGGSTTVVLFDLDGFKAINDTHGHGVGDVVLAAVAARLNRWAELIGAVAGRLGGDEFVLCLPASQWPPARTEDLRDLVGQPVSHRGMSLTVGASIGLATIRRCDGAMDPDSVLLPVLDQADEEMYQDKRSRKGGVLQDRQGDPERRNWRSRPVTPPPPEPTCPR